MNEQTVRMIVQDEIQKIIGMDNKRASLKREKGISRTVRQALKTNETAVSFHPSSEQQ